MISGAYAATITDANNCTLTIVEVIPSLTEGDASCVELFIPEIFSPNADGVNDKFEIKKVSAYPNNTLSIFNRWGTMVFLKENFLPNDTQNGWDGTAKGKARAELHDRRGSVAERQWRILVISYSQP